MGLLSKLFGRKKSKVEDHRLESEVESVISAEEALAGWVKGLRNAGAFHKEYKLVEGFISKVNPRGNGLVGGMGNVKTSEMTEEMKKFIRQYQVRGLKCSDKEFQDWITGVRV